ncbi:hypothetical protein HJFPF1_12964 [Paramyrothecium foliicola]|nr:hypothetical protein HJFPF1_12964 [Paramyrothecium foliicola]
MTLVHQQPNGNLEGHKLLILLQYPGIGPFIEALQSRFPGLEIDHVECDRFREESIDVVPKEAWNGVTILLTGTVLPSPEWVPDIKLVQLTSAGANFALQKPLFTETDVTLCTSNGVHGPQISEWIIATFLSHQHHLSNYWDFQKQAHWNWLSHLNVDDAVQQRVGILGYGAIGRQTARVCTALGMSVHAYTLNPRSRPRERADRAYSPSGLGDPDGSLPARWFSGSLRSELHAFLGSDLDLLVIALPLTPQTHHLISGPEFAVLAKKRTFLSNVARGAIVDPDALYEALDGELIRGAALDVTEPEPLPDGHKLWRAKNIIITPHCPWALKQMVIGHGLFATHGIAAGTRIIQEPPLLTVMGQEGHPAQEHVSIPGKIGLLSAEARGRFMDLYYCPSKLKEFKDYHGVPCPADAAYIDSAIALAIYYTNAATISTSDMQSGLFPTFCRMNHSCSPNTSWVYDDSSGMMEVYTSHDVKQGEELTDAYIDVATPRARRARELSNWGFQCACSVCSGPQADEHEKRRCKIWRTNELLALYEEKKKGNQGAIPAFAEMPKSDLEALRPLPGSTFIRVLLLAPGEPDDDVFCWLKLVNLDRDYHLPDSTAPQPLESYTFETAETSTGEELTFDLPMDVYYLKASDGHMLDVPRHPFQRYTALSYVWGSTENPEYIFLNGRNKVPVTRNLFEALQTLRLPKKGRRLWIDAICINQQDPIEKESQVRLMQRIYRQADSVLAFVPVSEQDQGNLQELIPRIVEAGNCCEEARQSRDEALDGHNAANKKEPRNTEGLLSLASLKVRILEIDEESDIRLDELARLQIADQEDRHHEVRNIFLEDFNLPLANDPLWASWRRFFATPYFGRIWILQEFALAKRLEFCFGHVTCEANFVMLAVHYIKIYSGAMNAHYIGHRHPGDPESLSVEAVRGMHAFDHMSSQRILAQYGDDKERLIDLLSKVAQNFQATDPKDKIYGLLGLVGDGGMYQEHVKYLPDETYLETYIRFAKLLVEGGHGLQLICQAGLRVTASDLPSWVPDWTSIVAIHKIKVVEQASRPMSMTVIDKTLVMTGAIVDEICEMGTPFADFQTISDFVEGFSSSCQKLSRWLESSKSSNDSFRIMFHALIGNELPQSDVTARAHLQKGFKSFMNVIRMISENLETVKEGKLVAVQNEYPQEHRTFLNIAQRATIGKRFGMTKGGFFGFIPSLAQPGDHVFRFENSRLTGLPPPPIMSLEELREKATDLSRNIFSNYARLQAILSKHERASQRRWMKKKKQQKIEIFGSTWPGMAEIHRHDFDAWRRDSVQPQAKASARAQRKHFMCPCINQEDLVKPKTWLLLLNSRGHHPPPAFARVDFDAMHFGCVSRNLVATYLNTYIMILHNVSSPGEYGKFVSRYDDENAFQWICERKQFLTGEGLLVL